MKDGIKIGTMLSEIPFANMPLLFKNAGFDFFIIDNEHGAFDYRELSRIVMTSALCGLKVIVRISDNLRKDITKMADMGVNGFLLPMTDSVSDIAQVVKYAKYAPIGKRGISTTRAHTLYNPPKLADYMPAANARMEIYAQIETVNGVNNIDEILALEGVSGAFMGPNDLSCDYGCIGSPDPQPIYEAIKKVSVASNSSGKPCGIITADKKYIDFAKESGFRLFSVGSELNMIMNAGRKIVSELNS